MFSRQRLFWLSRLYDLPASDGPFLRACRDMAAFHMKNCPEYRAIAEKTGFDPDSLRAPEDLEKLPLDGRPMSQKAGTEELYRIRKPLYEEFAEAKIANDGTPEEAVERILAAWEE